MRAGWPHLVEVRLQTMNAPRIRTAPIAGATVQERPSSSSKAKQKYARWHRPPGGEAHRRELPTAVLRLARIRTELSGGGRFHRFQSSALGACVIALGADGPGIPNGGNTLVGDGSSTTRCVAFALRCNSRL